MNRVSKFATAAILASMTLAGVGHAADSVEMNWAPELEKTLTTFTQPFNVEYTSDYNINGDDRNTFAEPLPAPEIVKLQAAIESNKPLTRRLMRHGAIIKDIVNAQQAADGSVTFWSK